MNLDEEQRIVELAKSDPDAFGTLFDYYYPQITNYTLRRVDDAEAACDIVASTFFKAWHNLPKFTWRGISFSAWLYRIAGNEIKDYYRKTKRQPMSIDALYESTGFEVVSEVDLAVELDEWYDEQRRYRDFQIIKKLLLKLPLKYQEVLALRFFEKKSLDEIAEITGKNLNTVKSLLKRGIEKLQVLFADQTDNNPNRSATFSTGTRYKGWKKQL